MSESNNLKLSDILHQIIDKEKSQLELENLENEVKKIPNHKKLINAWLIKNFPSLSKEYLLSYAKFLIDQYADSPFSLFINAIGVGKAIYEYIIKSGPFTKDVAKILHNGWDKFEIKDTDFTKKIWKILSEEYESEEGIYPFLKIEEYEEPGFKIENLNVKNASFQKITISDLQSILGDDYFIYTNPNIKPVLAQNIKSVLSQNAKERIIVYGYYNGDDNFWETDEINISFIRRNFNDYEDDNPDLGIVYNLGVPIGMIHILKKFPQSTKSKTKVIVTSPVRKNKN